MKFKAKIHVCNIWVCFCVGLFLRLLFLSCGLQWGSHFMNCIPYHKCNLTLTLKLSQSVRGHFVRLIEVGMCVIIACNPGHIWGVGWLGHKNFASESYDFWDLTPSLNCILRQEFWLHIISPHPCDILPSISLLWTNISSGLGVGWGIVSLHFHLIIRYRSWNFSFPLETRLHFFTGLVVKLCLNLIVF